jgi:hypothetical protein
MKPVLVLPAPRIEYRTTRLVAEQPRRRLQQTDQMIVQRLQLGGRCPTHCASVERSILTP